MRTGSWQRSGRRLAVTTATPLALTSTMREWAERSTGGATEDDAGIAPGKVAATSKIFRKGGGAVAGADAALASVAGSSGAALPEGPRGRFESSLGTDLSSVRVHTGGESASAAEALQARAFTVGQDIHFGAGQYQPDDPFGMHLLGHEVAHTVQQGGQSAGPQTKLEVSEPGDALEVEADAVADSMVRGEPARVTASAVGAARMIHRFDLGGSSAGMDGAGPGAAAPASGGATASGGTLQLGSQGPAVEELQRQLAAAGHACAVDGKFGPATRAAVVAFQRAHGLAADGIVGPMTRAALAQAPAGAAPANGAPANGAPANGNAPAGGGAPVNGNAPAATPAPASTSGAAPATTPAGTHAGPEHAAPAAENAADKAIASPTRQAIVSAARSKIGSVFSDVAGDVVDGEKTRKGWESLTEIFDLAFPSFPKQIIKFIKYGKNNGKTANPNGLVSWCGIFATWAVMTGGGNAGTWTSGNRVSAMNKITRDPKPGDVGYFDDWTKHHCIIAAVDGDRIETIDGNSYDGDSGGNGAITSKWRSRGDFSAFFKQVDD